MIARLSRFASLAFTTFTLCAGTLHAAPLLRCQVAYAGTSHAIEARIVSDPYAVASVDIGGRFRFKAVMVGSGAEVAYINLYAYVDTPRQPVLVHQAKYLPPLHAALTGEQHVYAGPVERELIYSCLLEGLAS